MASWFNNITYGNLNQRLLEILKKKCIADAVIPVLDKTYGDKLNFPQNNSDSVKEELNDMVQKVNSLKDENNKSHYFRYLRYDRNLLQSIIAVFTEKGLDIKEIVENVDNDISPTIIKLKQKYQRPRLNQLAEYYKLKLFPFSTISGHSPSYPSGHTLQAYVILNIVANKHPQSYSFCKEFINDVANSRVYLGLHYPSDNDASFIIGQEILKLPSIIKKYNI